MYKRIIALRKALKMNKTAFAHELGMTEGAIRSWESNKSTMKESSILLIIRTFNVNPEWLRNGKGEMFLPTVSEELMPVVDWMKSLSEKESIKLREEIELKFSSFKKWIDS